MYLKSLTLRGFKSFASATTLRFEPGITCIVGPNGSGKSNVVDALAWVMGEQGAKSLRGGKMEDVVFAGTTSRPALGRAEVALTIDNSDGALPIDYAEVTISRLMFRSGQSEYAINGDTCRLLDVQELLSDSGIGREMHVIVGQGQLDAVLHAGPDERRALVEEAAGVLKHRKRKEKALRKLDAMQANLTRLQDLTAELRRQLKPLGRQAEIARRSAVIQADLRDARLRLLADDLLTLRTGLAAEEAQEAAVRERRGRVEGELRAAQQRESELEEQAAAAAPALAGAQDTWFALSAVKERLRGIAELAAERNRNLTAEVDQDRPGPDPEELDRQAARAAERERELAGLLEAARSARQRAGAERAEAETAVQEEERAAAVAARAAAARREATSRLAAQVAAKRSRTAAAQEEIDRLTAAAAQAAERAERARAEHGERDRELGERGDDEGDLEGAHEAATSRLEQARARLGERRGHEQAAQRERAALAARVEALELGLAGGENAAGAVLAAADRLAGVLGAVTDLVEVEPGAETAVAAALGAAAEAVAVADLPAAAAALTLLAETDAGSASLVVAAVPERPTGTAGTRDQTTETPSLPEHARAAGDLVTTAGPVGDAVRALLAGIVVVDDLDRARRLVEARPELRAVTRDGDLLGRHYAHGGSGRPPSRLELQAAADEARDQLAAVTDRCARAARELAAATAEESVAAAAAKAALRAMNEARARGTEASGELGRLAAAAAAAEAEARRLTDAARTAAAAREEDLLALETLEDRLAAATDEAVDDAEPAAPTGSAERATAARQAEMEALLALRTAEERLSAVAGRAESLRAAAVRERQARELAARRRRDRAARARVSAAVAAGAQICLGRIEAALAEANRLREAAERARTERDSTARTLRVRIRELTAELDQLVGAVHGSEVSRAEQRLRLEQLATRAVEEFGVEPETLIAEYGPRVGVPVAPDAEPAAGGPGTQGPDGAGGTVPYDRAEQEKRAAKAARQLQLLGKVNPLALEEFAALEERHAFLTTQLEDLKKTRKDLLTVVKEVDDRVQQVFTAAYADTAREFALIFSRLFPGGEGRLLLTDPDDMLTTGIEVEARPPGKKVKRLSLLSGGERSLTAIAFLIAIFKARPSPFYVLDEVEAALDDTNLQRLIGIFDELRDSSQLIVITHQKRTMEVADALYGVSMRGDGMSHVVSQRLREPEPAGAPG